MKKFILLLIASVSIVSYSQKNTVTDVQVISKEAWIRGIEQLPELEGVPVKVLNFKPPQSGQEQLTVYLQASDKVTSVLKGLSVDQSTVPKLGMVVRTDTRLRTDEAYYLANAVIVSVKPSSELQTEAIAVVVSFKGFSKVSGANWNPGPPPGAPAVSDSGNNPGWICYEFGADIVERTELRINDFKPDYSKVQLTVDFIDIVPEVREMVHSHISVKELILVLPDKTVGHYVEFKLWNVKATTDPAEDNRIVFTSDIMECLTGADISH